MRTIIVLMVGIFLSAVGVDAKNKPEIKTYLKELKGKEYFIKIDVLRAQALGVSKHMAHVYWNGKVEYRGSYSWLVGEIVSDGIDRFIAIMDNRGQATPKFARKGLKVVIKKATQIKEKVEIKIAPAEKIDKKIGKHKIRLVFEDKEFTVDDLARVFSVAFTENEEDLVEKAVSIELGMSIEEAIFIKGEPRTRVNIGKKTILTYDDIKLIFVDGVLSDAQ